MTTATLIQSDAITVAQEIFGAKEALTNAENAFEASLLKATAIYLGSASDSEIAKAVKNAYSGKAVTTSTVGSWRRVGGVIERCGKDNAGGATAREILTAINLGFNAPGSFGVNVDPVLIEYFTNTDKPTWKGAIKAIQAKVNAKVATPKSDSEKFDAELAKQEAQVKKGYKPSAEQVARLIALSK